MEEYQNLISGSKLSTDYFSAYNILLLISPYLEYKDVVSCSEVCTLWNSIIRKVPFWSTYVMRCCGSHLEQILNKNELFKKLELKEVEANHVQNHTNILSAAINIEELTLSQCHFNFDDKLATLLETLSVFKIIQDFGRKELKNPYTTKFFNNMTNLTELSISTPYSVPLDALEALKQLKHLFIDANYSKGFFRTDLKFLGNLESFGVGFTHHKGNPQEVSKYNQLLSNILMCMKSIKKLLLYGLENDFYVLDTACKLEQLEILELGLIRPWNHYSRFLIMCKNIKNLCVKLILPHGIYLNPKELAAQNSILFNSIIELKNTIKEFTWIFDENYIKESEIAAAWQKDKWVENSTAIWNNMSDFKPQNFTHSQLLMMAEERDFTELHLEKLEEMLIKNLPNTKVRVVHEHFKKCEFCPIPDERKPKLHILKIERNDFLRSQKIHYRLCYKGIRNGVVCGVCD